ncbi:hypothetical protein FGB62_112g16 [Gracilaria domingensis]|nr:hypothetical protein FGB62_112g16 [Gracilaria domingensis]
MPPPSRGNSRNRSVQGSAAAPAAGPRSRRSVPETGDIDPDPNGRNAPTVVSVPQELSRVPIPVIEPPPVEPTPVVETLSQAARPEALD